MSDEKKVAIATLVAAIISVRGQADPKALVEAVKDAEWTIYPETKNLQYKEWQTKHGMTPTTPEEDAKKAIGRTISKPPIRN